MQMQSHLPKRGSKLSIERQTWRANSRREKREHQSCPYDFRGAATQKIKEETDGSPPECWTYMTISEEEGTDSYSRNWESKADRGGGKKKSGINARKEKEFFRCLQEGEANSAGLNVNKSIQRRLAAGLLKVFRKSGNTPDDKT